MTVRHGGYKINPFISHSLRRKEVSENGSTFKKGMGIGGRFGRGLQVESLVDSR